MRNLLLLIAGFVVGVVVVVNLPAMWSGWNNRSNVEGGDLSMPISGAVSSSEDASAVVTEIPDEELDKHLVFKGIPITGTMRDFCRRLQQKGVTYLHGSDGIAELKGDFAGYKDCPIHVATLDGQDLVYSVSADFPVRREWSDLENDYKTLKQLLAEKYGAPKQVMERFLNELSRDYALRMLFVHRDECRYKSVFVTAKGSITLEIENGHEAFVRLQYVDKINSEVVRSSVIDEL